MIQHKKRQLWQPLTTSLWPVALLLPMGALAQNSAPAPKVEAPKKTATRRFDFDKVKVGALPAGWKIEETNAKGPSSRWQAVADKKAPSPPQVLQLVNSRKHSGETFNLCWTDKIRLADATLRVRFRADKGREDQGGGLMWRVQNKDNYYVARFNPLEDNFRLYYVKNAQRVQLFSASVHLQNNTWHSMKVVFKGAKFSAFLDDKKYLEGKDTTIAQAGGVGLWTKADAETSFDDLVVRPGAR